MKQHTKEKIHEQKNSCQKVRAGITGQIRKRPRFSMRAFFILFVVAEFLLIDVAASLLIPLLQNNFPFVGRIPKIVWLLILSVILGSALTTFLVKFFFNPVLKLGSAMGRVAEGDFDVRLSVKNPFPDMRQINDDFNVMADKLSETEILQTEFISNVSHEFKTPINAIEGYATLLQDVDHPVSKEQEIYIEKILLNTKRLTNLVGNILLLSKVDNQSIQSNITTFRLDEQIRQAILSLESRWLERDTEFDADLETMDYTGSQTLLLHVWTNLIENAVKYGPRGGLIRMTLKKQQNGVIFTIEDEGPGIPKEAQAHIFDRFYQADNSRKQEGNGLGLALVKRILKQLGGSIGVENLPEKGCRFTVILP